MSAQCQFLQEATDDTAMHISALCFLDLISKFWLKRNNKNCLFTIR